MAANPLSIAQIKTFPVGSPVALVHGVLTEVYEYRTGIGKNKSTVQSAMLQDSTGDKIRLNIWNHKDYMGNKGAPVTIIAVTDKGKCSTRSIENTYHTPPTLELEISKTSQILFSGDQGQAAPADHSDPSESDPAAREGSAPRSQAVKRPINGQNAGMCVKEAIGLVKEAAGELTWEYLKSPDFYKDVWEISSNLVRVSRMVEGGDLAPRFFKPGENPPPPPPAQSPTPPVTPPPQPPPQQERSKPLPGPDGSAYDPDKDPDQDVPF